MTGYELFKRVCTLLGYYDLGAKEDTAKITAFLGMINQIGEDLGLIEVKSITEKIVADKKQKEALVYGCAMLFSASLNDGGCAKMYSQIYNGKRSSALASVTSRIDVLPNTADGGM